MIHFKSDRSLTPIPAEECTTLRIAGPLRSMIGRSAVHLTKSEALALGKWLGFPLDRPELETIPGPEDDRDSTAADLAPALRVDALARGTAAGSRPPAPKAAPRAKGRGGRRSPA